MAISEKTLKALRAGCNNYLYAFIPSASVKYFQAPVQVKRAKQIQFLRQIANSERVEESVVYKQVETYIREIYNLSPKEILVKLANGETVAGKNWKAGIYGIGSIPVVNSIRTQDLTFPNGYMVNQATGHIRDAKGRQLTTSKDAIVTVDPQKDASGLHKTYISAVVYRKGSSAYKSKAVRVGSSSTLQYIADIQSNGESVTKVTEVVGNVVSTVTSASKSADQASGEIWGNANVWVSLINKFVEWLLKLFNIRTVSEDEIAINQYEDGFTPIAENGGKTSMAGFGLLAGGLLLAMNMSGDKKKGKKRRK